MELERIVWIAITLLIIATIQVIYFVISPRFYDSGDLDRFDQDLANKKRGDLIATCLFLIATTLFSVWNIWESNMSSQITKKQFDDLTRRVEKLENDHPPGTSQALAQKLSELEASLNNFASKTALENTSDELKRRIKRTVFQIEEVKKLLRQRGEGQVQEGN